MSELIQKNESRDFRWKLLTEASALALISYVAAMPVANAEDGDRPTVWIELGGQLSRWENSKEPYAPSFAALTPSNLSPPQKSERPPRYGVDESASLIFQPKGSEWSFSASIRYGRTSNSKRVHEQSNPEPYTAYLRIHRSRNGRVRDFTNYYTKYPLSPRFVDVVAKQSESHTLLDFRAGKDLGIGLFGRNALSTLDIGVRFAQFTSKSRVKLKENPDWQFNTQITTFHTSFTYYSSHYSLQRTRQAVYQPFHSFAGTFLASRSFNGLGPSISWNSSEHIAGSSEGGSLAFDWGVNAAILFGRQKTKIHHQTTGRFHSSYAANTALPITYQRMPPDQMRSRGVVVPNIGAFAGFSVKYPSAKVSFGYKADFFFGAMDGGIDARRMQDIGFHGPYASISIGLGG
jgi:hypothetical protein